MSCKSCGLIRGGATPAQPLGTLPPNTLASGVGIGAGPTGPEPTVAPPYGAPARRPARRGALFVVGLFVALLRTRVVIVILFVVIGGVVAWYSNAARSSSGAINKSGDLTVTDLRVGDCFDLKSTDATTVNNVTARPCSEQHQHELFYSGSMLDGSYPDDSTFSSYVAANCGPAFGSYVGMPYQSSSLDVYYFTPTSASWSDGNRTVECAVYDPSNAHLTVSLKGATR